MENSSPFALVAYEHTYDRFHVETVGVPHDLLNATYLKSLSCHEWRAQDHYRVLSLGHMRRRVTPDLVRLAYRAYVLRWHPDKCGGNDHVFKCMAKASAILSDEQKRRAFDSVDPTFDESIPDEMDLHGRSDFFHVMSPVFDRNAHFSKVQPVPSLGDLETPRADVERFYEFWSKFDSWRSFEYLHPAGDGADSDHENRMDKRYKEKQAKAAQGKAKAADNARLGRLVDLAYRHDPRIRQWREEDNARKQAKRQERQQSEQQTKRAEEEARRQQEELARQAAEEERLRKQADKETREAERNKFRQEKRTLKAHFQTHQYFSQGVADLEATALLLEQLLAKLTLSSEVEQARLRLEPLQERSLVMSALQELLKPTVDRGEGGSKDEGKVEEEKVAEWTAPDLDVLIQAVKMFPGGVAQRWQRITEHVNAHCQVPRTVSQVTKQCEQLKSVPSMPSTLAVDPKATAEALKLRRKDPRIDQNEPSLNPNGDPSSNNSNNGDDWTKEEQARLEKALRMVPASDPQRWDKIAKLVGNSKTRKHVVERVKHIQAMLKQQ